MKGYNGLCAGYGQYRVPKEVLVERGPASAVAQLETLYNTTSNQMFWASQEMKCLVNVTTGEPEWDYSSLVACEPRNCRITEELLRATNLKILNRNIMNERNWVQVWSGPPNVPAGMPLTFPAWTFITYYCDDIEEWQDTVCESTYFTAIWLPENPGCIRGMI